MTTPTHARTVPSETHLPTKDAGCLMQLSYSGSAASVCVPFRCHWSLPILKNNLRSLERPGGHSAHPFNWTIPLPPHSASLHLARWLSLSADGHCYKIDLPLKSPSTHLDSTRCHKTASACPYRTWKGPPHSPFLTFPIPYLFLHQNSLATHVLDLPLLRCRFPPYPLFPRVLSTLSLFLKFLPHCVRPFLSLDNFTRVFMVLAISGLPVSIPPPPFFL